MKKLLLVGLFLFPTLAFAQTFDTNLSYGSTGSDVSALQEFLVTQHLLAPQFVTGNFYSITLGAVKAFQTAESISPVSGFVGPITRGTINTLLAAEVTTSEENAATTTEPVDLSATTTIPAYTPPQVIYVPAPAQTNTQTFGSTQPAPVVVPAPTCTVAMGVNMEPSSFATGRLAGIVQWTSTNTVSGSLSVGGHAVILTPVAGGSIKDFSIMPSDQSYVANFVGTDGSSVTCTPQFTPSLITQMVSLTTAYNSQTVALNQDITSIQSQENIQVSALNNSGGESGLVTGEIAQVETTAGNKITADQNQESALTTTYNSQIAALSTVQ